MNRTGIVVPTTFSRPEYFENSVASAKSAGASFLIVVSPSPSDVNKQVLDRLVNNGVVDLCMTELPGLPLAEVLNQALMSLPDWCDYMGWLGDDDLLLPDSIQTVVKALDQNPDAVMVYGGCDYIDPSGKVIGTNRSSQFAATLLHFGPQLIPQPGSLWRRDAFEKIGGLSSDFNLAFDFDLFLRLSREGKLLHVNKTLAQFRWHLDSLSVKRRWVSVSEASRVRRRYYSGAMRVLWVLWEPPVMITTWIAGKLLNLRAKHSRL